MNYATGSKAGVTNSTTAFSLATELVSVRAPSERIDQDIYKFCEIDIEVLGNDAAVSVKGVGPFPTSTAFDVTDGSFAIGGGKIKVAGYALGSLQFTTTGSAYTINIIRKISE